MTRIALGLEYRGDGFCGWQSQSDGCGVQDALEAAVASFVATGARYSLTCAGRTDAGVHALEQVVHFDAEVDRDEMSWVRGVNRFLPASVRVRWARAVDAAFHARFSAISRTYRYCLLVDRSEPAILKSLCGWYHLPLDIAVMERACALLVGRRDFSSFRAAECQAKSPVKLLHEARVAAHGPLIELTFRADAFLHHMVRNMVGALVQVGAGRLGLEEFAAMIEARDRRHAAPTFPPDGLYLAAIEYDAAFGLPPPASRLPAFAGAPLNS